MGTPPEIFGRDGELESLQELVRDARNGARALVLLGDPGIGKTTLWEAGVAVARARGHVVLSSRPSHSEAVLSYAALGDLLEGVDVPDELPQPQRHALDVALLRTPPDGGSADRRTISAAALGVLRWLSRLAPVLVAIDDAQWLDRSSAAVLAFCVRRLREEPIALLVAMRTGADEVDPIELTRALTDDRLQRRRVTPLEVNATRSLVEARFGRTFSRPEAARIHEASMGNPLFALEFARAMLDASGGQNASGLIHAPADIRELLRARLSRLPQAVHDVLLSAAASARPSVSLLGAVTARPETVEGLLKRAVDVDVIEVDGEDVRFTHPLLASAVYDEASQRRRQDAHRRLAEASDDPEERARHLAFCTPEPDAEVAAALEKAARLAIDRGAPSSAAALGEEGLRFTPPGATEDRHRRQLAAAEHHFLAGDQGAATRLARAAVASSTPGPTRALALERLGRIAREDDLHEGERLLAAAVAEVGATERIKVEGLLDLAEVSLNLGHLEESAKRANEALRLAQRVGDDVLMADALSLRALPRAYLGFGVDREGLARASRVTGSLDRLPVTADPRASLAELLVVTDDLDEALPILSELLATAETRGDEPSAEFVHAYLARLGLRAGRWDEALKHSPGVGLWGDERAIQAIVLARRGEFDEARSAAGQTLESAEGSGHIGPLLEALEALGIVELARGQPDDANLHLTRAWDVVQRAGLQEPNKAAFIADWIEVLTRIGDTAQADALIEWLVDKGRSLDRPRALAIAARGRARLSALAGDLVNAIDHLNRALVEHRRLPDPFELGRTLLEMGMVRRRAKQKRPAREVLDRAVAIFDGLGAAPWSSMARSEIAAIGGRASSAGGLTPTEERIARLASAGLNNREIAGRLFLSMRTVEGHLSNAYRKLGIHSRSQLRHVLDDAQAGVPSESRKVT